MRTEKCQGEGRSRIVLFISISAWLGGPGSSLATVLAHLPENIVPVLASPSGGDLVPTVRASSRIVEHIPIVRRRGQVPDPLGRMRAMLTVARWILRHRRSLLCVHANGSAELHLAALGALLGRVPIVVWFHGSEVGRWDRRLGPIWRCALRRRRLAAVSRVAATVASQMGIGTIDEIAIVPNPIDPTQCRSLHATPFADSGKPEEIVVGFLGGTVRPGKGFSLLPEIVASVADERVRWLIFGERRHGDPEESVWARLEKAGAGRITAARWATDVRSAYARCDIVLCPSLKESFNRIVAEAMINCLPVVASDIPAHRALLGEGEAGLLFPLDHPEAAGAAIGRLAQDPFLRRRLGEAGRRKAREFEPRSIVAQLIELYNVVGTR